MADGRRELMIGLLEIEGEVEVVHSDGMNFEPADDLGPIDPDSLGIFIDDDLQDPKTRNMALAHIPRDAVGALIRELQDARVLMENAERG